MNELLITLVHGGNWTERERHIGRWVRRVLLVLLTCGALVWNNHWQDLGAKQHVWRTWVNDMCMTGERDACMSYVYFAKPSGLPDEKFWTAHPHLAQQAACLERAGWVTLSIGRQDYSGLMFLCEPAAEIAQESRAPSGSTDTQAD